MHRFAALALATTLAAGCAGGDEAPEEAEPTTTTTAAAPEHGDLLEHEEVDAGLDADTSRVTYASTSPEGEPIEVTGIADECAPSLTPDGYAALANGLLDAGYAVVATDYEGLGTPGLHPYLHGTSEGRGTLDIVRAAAELAGVEPDALPVLVWGHSQGGHAALFAGELADEWTPELDVRGVVAGAPATELPLIAGVMSQGTGLAGFLAMIIAGWADAEPERADLSLITTPAARALLDEVAAPACTSEYFVAMSGLDGPLTTADPSTVEPWRELFVENDPGRVATDLPILVVHGDADPVVPPALSQLFHDRVCALGQRIERRLYPGADHGSVIGRSFDDVRAWMQDRLDGEPPPSTCPASP